jgi:hypothetical protein
MLVGRTTVTTANISKMSTIINTGNPSITVLGLYKSDIHG